MMPHETRIGEGNQRKTLLVTLVKDKVAIRSAPHMSCEVHAFLGDA